MTTRKHTKKTLTVAQERHRIRNIVRQHIPDYEWATAHGMPSCCARALEKKLNHVLKRIQYPSKHDGNEYWKKRNPTTPPVPLRNKILTCTISCDAGDDDA